jgi:carbamoyltransferase
LRVKILGLNFGHDAGVSLITDGVFERHWEKERHVRIRHALGLSAADILAALSHLGIELGEIDRVAITCTQAIPIMLFGDIDVRRTRNSGWPLDGMPEAAVFGKSAFYQKIQASRSWYRAALAWAQKAPRLDIHINEDLLGQRHPETASIRKLAELLSYTPLAENPAQKMCFGIEVRLANRVIPGAYISHHLCHAYYGYVESQVRRALIVTVDGVVADSFKGGGIFLARDGAVNPLVPHGCWYGPFYENVALRLQLGAAAAGKLMGLSAWGKPVYYDEALVGNWFDLPSAYTNGAGPLTDNIDFGRHAMGAWERARELKFSPAALRSADVPPAREANIASSVQKMFEDTMLKVVEAADGIAKNAGFDYEAIVLGGGCALNCPANSLIYGRFGKPVMIPPAVNDEGISAGAALALHSLLGQGTKPSSRRSMGRIAYKGMPYAVTRADVEPYLDRMELVETGSPAAYLAKEIAAGAIVGIFEKGAEIGPRALGHRSLVGSPLIAANWPRLNTLKGREQWRPFAPIVLPEDAERYFEGFPPDSYYMLFNARARTKDLPAVTHVDGTARVQIAHPDNGFVFTLLQQFKQACGCGVLINTSFNGRNEPIVETPTDALQAFMNMGFDFLYLDGLLLKTKDAPPAEISHPELQL